MDIAHAAFVISCTSLVIAISNFGWTYYKDTRFRRRITVKLILAQAPPFPANRLQPVLEVRNHGPGSVTLDAPMTDHRGWLKRRLSRLPYSIVLLKNESAVRLEAGQIHQLVMSDQQFALSKQLLHVGYRDNWRNEYWAPRSDVRRVTERIKQMPQWKHLSETKQPPSPVVPPTKDENLL